MVSTKQLSARIHVPSKVELPSLWTIVTSALVFHILFASFVRSQSNEASVRLNQGLVVGIKVFPEYSRTSVFSFLGIPYAQPPMNELRFAPPVAHVGWNRTLYARNFQAICPQPELNIYEESTSGYLYQSRMSENCLFLNIWTPENCLRYGKCPILVVISGEEQTFDWARNRPTGLDLAVDGVVVLTVQSRSNIFGWLTTGHSSAPGNLGLLDQHLALKWVQVNGPKFGGSTEQVTLLGHGTSGAANAMIHLTGLGRLPRYFNRLIIMSGSLFSPWSFQVYRNPASPSLSIIRNLACESTNPMVTLECLRQKSVSDLLNAFGNIYKNGNYTDMLGPQVDWYLEKTEQLISRDPRLVISKQNYTAIPTLIGICSNEGAFIRDYWLDLSREGYAALNTHVQRTLLPNIMHHYGFTSSGSEQIRQTINWRFFDQIPRTIPNLLDAVQRLQSEAKFERPFFETIEIMSRVGVPEAATLLNQAHQVSVSSALASRQLDSDEVIQLDDGVMEHRAFADLSNDEEDAQPSVQPQPLFVYAFQQGMSMDLRGRTNYFGGAGHTADLLFLMGPSLFQQIGRRKMTQSEERLCKKVRRYFVDFVKTGNPTPGRLFDAWVPYKSSHKFVQLLGDPADVKDDIGYLNRNQMQIAQMLSGDNDAANAVANTNPYSIDNSRIDTSTVPKSYLPDPNHSPFFLAIGKVASFWDELLPKMTKIRNGDGTTNPSRQDVDVSDPTSSKYRHAFFSMLTLVCLLLAAVGVCLYILQRNRQTIDTSYL